MKKRYLAAFALAGVLIAGCAGRNGGSGEAQQKAGVSGEEMMLQTEDLERKYSEMEQSNSSLIGEKKELEQSNEDLRQVNRVLWEQYAKSGQSGRANMMLGEIRYTVPGAWMTMAGRENENELWHFPNEKDVLIVQVYNMESSLGESPAKEQQKEVLDAFYAGYLSKMKNACEGGTDHTQTPDGAVAMKAEIYSDTADGRVKDTLYELMRSGRMYLFTFREDEGGVYDADMQSIIDSISFPESGSGKNNSVDDGQAAQNSDSPEITLEEYEKIEEGMSYEQAAALIGSGGREAAASSENGCHIAIYTWEGNGGFASSADIIFLNDEMFRKSQSGLK